MLVIEIVKKLLDAVLSPQPSPGETVAQRRAIAYSILVGVLSGIVDAVSANRSLARMLPRELLQNATSSEGGLTKILRAAVDQLRPELEREFGQDVAKAVAAKLSGRLESLARKTPADILPAEERAMFMEIGYRLGVVMAAIDSATKFVESPSRI